MRADPYVMYAHSAPTCQCSSRMPPVISRISTPATFLEMGRSRTVTWRVHPPSSIRLCAKLNGYLNGGCPPASVTGGNAESEFEASSDRLPGPGCDSLWPLWSSPLESCVCWADPRMGRLAAAAKATEPLPRKLRRLSSALCCDSGVTGKC